MSGTRPYNLVICFFLFSISLFVFSRGLGSHGFECRVDETAYIQSAQAMLSSGQMMSLSSEPSQSSISILFSWLMMCAYRWGGAHWITARFVAAVFAALTVCLTWLLGTELFRKPVAFLGVVIMMTTPLFILHAQTAVPDMATHFFIVLAMYALVKFIDTKKRDSFSLLFFMACALGFMSGGIPAVVLPILVLIIFAWATRTPQILRDMRFGRGAGLFLIMVLPACLMMSVQGGGGNRLLGLFTVGLGEGMSSPVELIMAVIQNFGRQCWTHVCGLFVAGLPWSLFAIIGLPFAVNHCLSREEEASFSLQLCLIWFFSVFFGFCFWPGGRLFHMLYLIVPASLMVGYFLCEPLDKSTWPGRLTYRIQKYIILTVFTLSYMAFIFVAVFLAGVSQWWLVVLAVGYIAALNLLLRRDRPVISPLVLGGFLLFVLAQAPLWHRAALTPHAAYQSFAAVVQKTQSKFFVTAIDPDIPSSLLRMYFGSHVAEAMSTQDQVGFSVEEGPVYSIIRQSVYDDLRAQNQNSVDELFNLVEEFVVIYPKRIRGSDVWRYLVRGDMIGLKDVWTEKLYLVRKDSL